MPLPPRSPARLLPPCLLFASLSWSMAHAAADPAAAGGMSMSPVAARPHDAADQAMMSGMGRMKRQMADTPMTGDADRDFVSMMLPHHAGAIDMAKVELRYGKDPGLRRLARDIVGAQEREIAQMRAWMATHPAG